MNVISFLTGIFRGQSLDGQLDAVRRAAQQDAELVVGTYTREFEAATARILMGSQNRLLDYHPAEDVEDDAEDVEYEVHDAEVHATDQPDYLSWDRPSLLHEAKQRGLTIKRTDKVKDLARKLERSDRQEATA